MTRTFVILGVIAVALIACLWVAGVIQRDVAQDSLARGLGTIAIVCFAAGLITRLLPAGSKSGSESGANKQGPQF